jgi:hypothetical protein
MTKQPLLKLPVVNVVPTLNDDNITGIVYSDDEYHIEGPKRCDKIDHLFSQISESVSDKSSILLYKEDVKRFADQLASKSHPSKEIFREIKARIRAEYTVLKLSFDPRTLQFNGIKTAFIIHSKL